MMDVRIVGMGVGQGLVRVGVGVRLPRWILRAVGVLMMHVMGVTVTVGQPIMRVLVEVALGEVQPDSGCHEPSCREQRHGDGLPPEQD
jgi:hypothetical protein